MKSSSSSSKSAAAAVVLRQAPPPLDAIVLITLLAAFAIATFPSWDSIDEVATVPVLTKILFPHYLSVRQLAILRAGMALVIWATTIEMVFLSPGWDLKPVYLPRTQLQSTVIRMRRLKTLATFTCVTWNILGLYFTLSSYIAWQVANAAAMDRKEEANDTLISKSLLRITYLLWETVAPSTFLVSVAIRYAIWPTLLASGADTSPLKRLRALLMHNANVVFALAEVALLSGLPVRAADISMGMLIGICYIVVSWCVSGLWDAKRGPQFLYFFLDTTLPGYMVSGMLAALVAVLVLFHAFFASCEVVLEWLAPAGWVGHLLFVVVLTTSVMRFRD